MIESIFEASKSDAHLAGLLDEVMIDGTPVLDIKQIMRLY